MLDVLLLYPPVSYSAKALDLQDDLSCNHPPLGYLYLAGQLRDKGFKVGVIDTSCALSLREIIRVIKDKKPKVVGISAVTANMRGAYQLATEIKKKIDKKTVVILGGHHVSSDPEVVKRHPCFDIGVTGEGEITFTKIVDEIVNKRKRRFKKLYIGELPEDLDKIPFPARDLIDFSNYKDLPAISILTSRGCPYNCIFCSRPAISRQVRFRSPGLVVKEMIEAHELIGMKEFVFQDDTINLNREHVLNLCKEITKSKQGFTWTAYGRFNLLDEGMVKAMAEAGCVKLMFGVEAGNEKLRNEVVKKAITDDQIRKGVKLCRKYNIEADAFLMLGFPTETKKEIDDTINFGKKFNFNMIGVHITAPFPGSFLWDDLAKKGEIGTDLIDQYILGKMGEGFRKNWPNYVPEGMTIDDLLEARAKAHRSFYFRPQYVLDRIRRDFTSWRKIKEDFIEAYCLFRYGRSHRGG